MKGYPQEKLKALAAVQVQLMKDIDMAAQDDTKMVYQGGQMREIRGPSDPCSNFNDHVKLLNSALFDFHLVDSCEEVLRCPKSAAVKHGDFPEIEEKLALAKEPRHRNIVKTL